METPTRFSSRWARFVQTALPRGLALFLGAFALSNVAGSLYSPLWDGTLWWLDFRPLSPGAVRPLLALSALSFLAYGVCPPRSTWRRFMTAGAAALLGVVALVNAAGFYRLLLTGRLHSAFPVPLSLGLAVALGLVLVGCLRPFWLLPRQGGFGSALAVGAACALLFPLAQMFCFGLSDYRRPATVAVVLGARAYADGRPSQALADRVRTACQLYQRGQVRRLLMSGGPGDGAFHETEVMRRLAIELGVRSEDILVDEGGLNTQATVRDTEPLLRQMRAQRVLVVSHFYHLPRVKLAYQRVGREVCTVPARESRLLGQLPFNMARETVAFWSYYFRLGGAGPV